MCVLVHPRCVLCLRLCCTWGGHRRPFPDVGLRWRWLPGHRWVLRRRDWPLGLGVRMVISHPTLPGVLRASTSEKPLELTRLVKQCSDILKLCDWDWHGMVLRTGTLSSAPNMEGQHMGTTYHYIIFVGCWSCWSLLVSRPLLVVDSHSGLHVPFKGSKKIGILWNQTCWKTVAIFQGDTVFF